jgi:hypothetical protein
MPENMFDRLFGLGVEEKVFVLTHLVRVGALLGALPSADRVLAKDSGSPAI